MIRWFQVVVRGSRGINRYNFVVFPSKANANNNDREGQQTGNDQLITTDTFKQSYTSLSMGKNLSYIAGVLLSSTYLWRLSLRNETSTGSKKLYHEQFSCCYNSGTITDNALDATRNLCFLLRLCAYVSLKYLGDAGTPITQAGI